MQFPPELKRCYNCGLQGQKLISDLSVDHQNTLSLWTGQHVHEGVKVCLGCIDKIEKCKNDENPPREFGHKEICVGCGRSVIKKRVYILSGSILQILFPWYQQYKEVKTDHYLCCLPCQRRTLRVIKKMEESSRPAIKMELSDSKMEPDNESSSVNTEASSKGLEYVKRSRLSTAPYSHRTGGYSKIMGVIKTKEAIFQENHLILSTHLRAPETRRSCMIPKCRNQGKTLPRANRKLIFLQSDLYVHRRATLCKQHSTHNFHTKFDCNAYNHFSIDHIEDILNMIEKPVSIVNFDCVNDMPVHICKYWTGLTVEEFKDLYQKLNIDTGICQSLKNALAAHLLRKRTGDNIVRLANLFLMPTQKLSKQLQMIEKSIETYDNLQSNGTS